MNVTKTIAEDVAKAMLEPIKNKIDSVNNRMIEIAQKSASDSIPKEIKEMFAKHSSYFKKTKGVILFCGWHEISIYGLKDIPSYTEYYPRIETENEIIEELDKMQIEKDKLREEYSKTEKSIISTMLSLRTSKRVEKVFPEAYKHLEKHEKKESSSIALPIESIINTINKHN